MNNALVILKTILAVAVYLLTSASLTVAQPLLPDAEVSCDTAISSDIPLNPDGDEAAVCVQRTYEIPATDTLALRQENYGSIEIEAWNGGTIQVETTVVARRATDEEAQSDLARITLNQADAEVASTRLFAAGPNSDAPGWWSVQYRMRVPAQTMLAITTDSGRIDVQGVIGGHTLRSNHGSINVALPPRMGVRLQAETDYGTINVGFPVITQGAVSERLDAVVRGGGPTMRLVSGSDITIQRVE